MAGSEQTFSASRANEQINAVNNATSTTADSLQNQTNNFFSTVGAIWADKNVVELTHAIEKGIGDVSKTLNSNSESLVNTMRNVGNAYADKAGSTGVSAVHKAIAVTLNSSDVKEKFGNDKVGFLDINESPQTIANAMSTLVNDVTSTKSSLASKVRSIDAFGDQAIQSAISTDGKAMIDITEKYLEDLKAEIIKSIQTMQQDYANIGDEGKKALDSLVSGLTKY